MDFPNSETSVLCHEKTRFYPLISARAMISSADVTAYAAIFGQSGAPTGRTVAGKKWANFTALYLFNKSTIFEDFFFAGLEIFKLFKTKNQSKIGHPNDER